MTKPRVLLTRQENNLEVIRKDYPSVDWITFPLIHFEYQEIEASVLDTVKEDFDWLVFTSQNGVQSFMREALGSHGRSKIACVGPKTAKLAESFGLDVDFIPSHFTSLTLAKEMPSTSEESICYIGGNLSSEKTIAVLRDKAQQFLQIEVYQTKGKEHPKKEWEEVIDSNPTMVSFCSPSAVRSYVEQLNKYEIKFPSGIQYASIGSTTASAVMELLGSTSLIGKKHTFDAMIQAIVAKL